MASVRSAAAPPSVGPLELEHLRNVSGRLSKTDLRYHRYSRRFADQGGWATHDLHFDCFPLPLELPLPARARGC